MKRSSFYSLLSVFKAAFPKHVHVAVDGLLLRRLASARGICTAREHLLRVQWRCEHVARARACRPDS